MLTAPTRSYINAWTKNNIIPNRAELGLTVRTYKADVRKPVLEAITRIAGAEAQAAGAHLPSTTLRCFAPDVDPAMHTAIDAEVSMLRDLLQMDGS